MFKMMEMLIYWVIIFLKELLKREENMVLC